MDSWRTQMEYLSNFPAWVLMTTDIIKTGRFWNKKMEISKNLSILVPTLLLFACTSINNLEPQLDQL